MWLRIHLLAIIAGAPEPRTSKVNHVCQMPPGTTASAAPDGSRSAKAKEQGRDELRPPLQTGRKLHRRRMADAFV